jgi:hypothetical protein
MTFVYLLAVYMRIQIFCVADPHSMDLHVYKRAVYLLHLLAFLAASSNATGTSNTRSPPTSSMQTQDAQSTLVSSFYSPAQLSSSQSTNPDTSRNWRTSDISLIGAPQSTESFVISSSKDLHLTHRLSKSVQTKAEFDLVPYFLSVNSVCIEHCISARMTPFETSVSVFIALVSFQENQPHRRRHRRKIRHPHQLPRQKRLV